jgi:hypothetical protein
MGKSFLNQQKPYFLGEVYFFISYETQRIKGVFFSM